MKYFFTSVFLLFSIFQLKSQDAVFSQFYLSPLNLNPALAGTECGDQLIVNYRNEYRTFYRGAFERAISFSYDRSFSLKNGDKIGGGAKLFTERTGTFDLQKTNGAIAFSYQKNIFEKKGNTHFLVGGLEAGWSQKSVDFTDTTKIIAPDPEPFFGQKIKTNYPKIGVGFEYRLESENDINLNFGFAAFQINQPNSAFSDTLATRLPPRFVFHAMAELPISSRFIMRPQIRNFSIGESGFWTINMGFKYFLDEASAHGLEFGIGANLTGISYTSTLLFSSTYFYKNIGFSLLTGLNGEELGGDGIDSFEGAVIYRFCK